MNSYVNILFEAFEANLVKKVLNLIQILTLNNFGVHGGVTWWTRKMVEVMLTTLITGSPRGLGDDPELKVQIHIRIVVMGYYIRSLSGVISTFCQKLY